MYTFQIFGIKYPFISFNLCTARAISVGTNSREKNRKKIPIEGIFRVFHWARKNITNFMYGETNLCLCKLQDACESWAGENANGNSIWGRSERKNEMKRIISLYRLIWIFVEHQTDFNTCVRMDHQNWLLSMMGSFRHMCSFACTFAYVIVNDFVIEFSRWWLVTYCFIFRHSLVLYTFANLD